MGKDKNKIQPSVDENISKPSIWNNTSKELKETLNKIPELTKEYYKIASLSEEQKKTMAIWETIELWTKEKLVSYIDNKKSDSIIIKKRIEGPEEDAYVREYVDGVPEKFKGVQLFNKAAAKNLNLMKLLPTHGNLARMVGKRMWWRSDAAYEKNNALIQKFILENNLLSAGFYCAKAKKEQITGDDLNYIDSFRYYLLSGDDRTIEINTHDDKIERWYANVNKNHGYPIMLIKK